MLQNRSNIENIFGQIPRSYLDEHFHICEDIGQCLLDLEINNRLAIATSRQHALNHRISKIYCFDESQNIYKHLISMYVRKDHHAFDNIMIFTIRAFESGLFVKWERDSKIAHQAKPKVSTIFSLKLSHIYGSIFIYLLFAFLGMIFFLAEMYTFRKARVENSRRFWVICDLLIEGQRNFLVIKENKIKFFANNNEGIRGRGKE